MKRALIITYYWPPLGGSGVQRWLKFSKYLPKYQWQPVIYTPDNPDFQIMDKTLLEDIPNDAEILKTKIFEPYKYYRFFVGKEKNRASNFGMDLKSNKPTFKSKIVNWIRGNIFLPDPRVFWVRPSVNYLAKYIKNNPVNVVITTGPPHSMHLIGLGLKKRMPNLKWIADMRDPWANFDVYDQFDFSQKVKDKIHRLEKEVLNTADKIIMVSPSMHEEFNDFEKSKLEVINNGFDHEDFRNLIKPEFSIARNTRKKFTMLHAGLLNNIRNPNALWIAIEQLCYENKDFNKCFSLELVGSVDEKVQQRIKASETLASKVQLLGYHKHSDLLKMYQNVDALLLIVNNSRNGKAQIVGKVYEYLAAKKMILGLARQDSDVAQIINETNTGFICEIDDTKKIKETILKMFLNYQNKVPLEFVQKEIDQYSRLFLSKKLVNLLNSFCEEI